MRQSVTILSLAVTITAVLTAGCGGSRDAAAPKCSTVSASPSTTAADARVAAWRQRLPGVFRYAFERSADQAIMARPECVKTAAQSADHAKYVGRRGLLPAMQIIELNYEYLYTTAEPRVMSLNLERAGTVWTGTQSEDSWQGSIGLRQAELEIPSCEDADLARPEEISFVAKGGRATRVSALTDAPGTVSCR